MKKLLKEYSMKIFEQINNYQLEEPICSIGLNISKGNYEFIDITFLNNYHKYFTISFYNFYDEAGLNKKYNEFLTYLSDPALINF